MAGRFCTECRVDPGRLRTLLQHFLVVGRFLDCSGRQADRPGPAKRDILRQHEA